MKLNKIMLLIVGIVGILFGLVLEARSGGVVEPPPCVQAQSIGAVMQGTAGVAVINYDGASGDVDATLRLEWQGKEKFFRVHLSNAPILSPEDLTCRILDAQPTDTLGATIFDAFGIRGANVLKINKRSISGLEFDVVPGSGGNSSALADVTLYVVAQ